MPSAACISSRGSRSRLTTFAMPRLRPSHPPRAVGVGKQPRAERNPFPFRLLGLVAVNELREIELELVPVALGVRALHLAELALEAGVHDPPGLHGGDLANVAVVRVVQNLEEIRKAVAVLEAHSAAVADLEGAGDLFLESLPVPVAAVFGVVGQAIGGLVGDRLGGVGHGFA